MTAAKSAAYSLGVAMGKAAAEVEPPVDCDDPKNYAHYKCHHRRKTHPGAGGGVIREINGEDDDGGGEGNGEGGVMP